MASSTPNYGDRVASGVAAYLASLDILDWDERGEGTPYADAGGNLAEGIEWPTYIGPDMPATPDQIIVITPTVQSYMRADIVTGIQIRIRGARGALASVVADKGQAIFDALYPNGFPLVHVTMGTVRVGAVLPGDALPPLARDGERRHGFIQNFRLRTRRPRPE